ncbi:MAG: metallophosphoesterase [Myxococcaceae bacterium]|nr:metallophosphoesterase [Myxococcaceae bacterium]
MLVVAACKRDVPYAPPALPNDLPPVVDVDAGPVTLAAAGDISEARLGGQVLTAALVADGGYDAVLTLGDNQYVKGELAHYLRWFEPTWGRFRDKLYPVPGNHEYLTEDANGYFDYFGERAGDPKKGWYSFDLGAWHLVALNTNNGCRTIACDGDSAQVKWLREDLARHRNRCTLAFWHHPRWSSGVHHGPFKGAEALWKTLAQFDADVVLNGHEHFYERFEPIDGMRQFIVGTGGASAYPLMPTPLEGSAARGSGAFGILELTLEPGRYRWRFVPTTPGAYSDSGVGTCR